MLKLIQSIPQKLGRVTSGSKVIKQIDGLRFFAIIPVVIQHLTERFERNTTLNLESTPINNSLNYVASRGFLGVYIFFVISGFVLALPFAYQKLKNAKIVSLPQYYLRRVTRLEPTYIIWISVFYLIYVFYNHLEFSATLNHYLSTITYTHGLIYKEWSPINPPTWTLEIEIQFYILAPFLAIGYFSLKNKIVRRIAICVFITILMVIQQHFKLYADPYKLTILGHLHYFLIGFILADLFICDFQSLRSNILYDLLGILALIIVIYSWSWDFEFWRRVLFLVSMFVFFYSVFKSTYLNRFVSNNWITAIGGMCYTIYLIHLPLAELYIKFAKNIHITELYSLNLIIQLLVFVPIVLILSAIFFLAFEKPFMRKEWPRTFYNKLKTLLS